MKKNLLSIAAAILSSSCFSQQIENNSLENWTDIPYYSPTGWSANPLGVKDTNSSSSGNKAALLYYDNTYEVPGYLIYGIPSLDSTGDVFCKPFNSQPVSLSFDYKLFPDLSVDTAKAHVLLKNGNISIIDTTLYFTEEKTVFNTVTLQIGSQQIDSIALSFSINDNLGSDIKFIVDNISFSYDSNSSLNESELIVNNVYPNPFSENITIDNESFEIKRYQVFNEIGSKILENNVTNISKYMLNTVNFDSGIYYLLLEFDDHNQYIKLVKQM